MRPRSQSQKTPWSGKTHFARSLIQSQLALAEDVPSPSFTLVQTYDTKRGEIWHSDLYRLSSPFEIEELGLLDAFETAIVLVEWPDRLGELTPDTALSLQFDTGKGEQRRLLTASWQDDKWNGLLKGCLDD